VLGIIVAMSKNRVIGKGGAIPWNHKGDLRWFKETTLGSIVIMGRKTWDSLPDRARPLSKRLNIVVTRSGNSFSGAITACSVEQAVNIANVVKDYAGAHTEVWIIGGSEIYRESLKYATVIASTCIPEHVEVDSSTVTFPVLDQDVWQQKSVMPHPYNDNLRVVTLMRRYTLQEGKDYDELRRY